MPNVGTVVRLIDGRIAAVSKFTAIGDDDHVVFEVGHGERTNARHIAEILSDEEEDHPDPVKALRSYLAKTES